MGSSTALEPLGCREARIVETLEKLCFVMRYIANRSVKHVEKLELFMSKEMPVKHSATATSNEHGQIVNRCHGRPSLRVYVFKDTTKDIHRIVFRLVPSLWKASDYQLLTEDPTPELVDHEKPLFHFLPFAVPIHHLVVIALLRINAVVEELI